MKPTITGPELLTARLLAGLTRNQLAAAMNVTPGAICHWETGRNGISRKNHATLCRFLDLDPTQDKAEEAPPAPIALKWSVCGGCGRPSGVRQNSCTIICSHVADKVAGGMDPHDAVRSHLKEGYSLPAPPAQEANGAPASASPPRLAGPRISMVIEVDYETREALEQLAEDQYRTAEAQVAWIVKQHLAGRGGEG